MRRGRGGRALPAATAWLLATLAGCAPQPADPPGVAPPAPFVRAPYVQVLDSASAAILWRTRPDVSDSLLFRVERGDWSPATVERGAGGDRVARLAGLPAGAQIEYAVRADGARAGSASFRLAPSRTAEGPLRVLAFGDSGWGSQAQLRLARLMEEESWDLALHVGDIAYDEGRDGEFTRRHFAVYRGLLARTPFYPVPGNHDLRADGGASYDRAFVWPAPHPAARYYAVRWGLALFVALDTSSDTPEARGLGEGQGRQYAWLVATLGEAQRDTTLRWTVVFSHHPLYSHAVGLSGHGPEDDLRRTLAPLFEATGVDLVLAGHDHHYERTHPVRGGRPAPPGCGPVYMLTGGGGAARFARGVGDSPLAARTSPAHHFVALRISRTAIEGTAVGVEGLPVDEFRLAPYEPGAEGCR